MAPILVSDEDHGRGDPVEAELDGVVAPAADDVGAFDPESFAAPVECLPHPGVHDGRLRA